ncbi:MAG: ATP-binding protein [Candidatus Latescibacterota bacterium]|nr:MAG: ATP-binding protein [Candidatus Latescibacterota bacterium]
MAGHHDVMELIIPSDFKYLGAVDAAVQDLAREFSCAQRWIDDFTTALVEACTNAIEHGNKFIKDKKVRITIELNEKKIISRVRDQGAGFEYESYLTDAPPPEPDPLSERGRGIMIMRAFTDGIGYVFDPKDGLCVELTKTCEPDAETDS